MLVNLLPYADPTTSNGMGNSIQVFGGKKTFYAATLADFRISVLVKPR